VKSCHFSNLKWNYTVDGKQAVLSFLKPLIRKPEEGGGESFSVLFYQLQQKHRQHRDSDKKEFRAFYYEIFP
jgi:hypothetical protein